MFRSILKKKQGTSANGCGGLFSQNCIDGLKRQLMLPANNAGGMNADTKCPNFVASDSGIKSACGGTTIITGSTTIGTGKLKSRLLAQDEDFNPKVKLPRSTSQTRLVPVPRLPKTSTGTFLLATEPTNSSASALIHMILELENLASMMNTLQAQFRL